jgi:hypothetical protein
VSPVRLPVPDKSLSLVIKGKSYVVTCTDVFDGGYGYYFDAVFPKKTRYKFSAGEQCLAPELGDNCKVDFVSYSPTDQWKVRFLLLK